MASVRLTSYMRDTILERLLQHAFAGREEVIQQRRCALGNKVYYDIYPPKLREKMEALPNGLLPTDTNLLVRFGDGSGDVERVFWKEERRISYDHRSGVARAYAENHPFTQEFRTLGRKREALKEEKDTAKRSALSILNSVTTLNKLIEIWPEVSRFAQDFQDRKTGQMKLPAVVVKDVNARLGL